MTHPKTTFLPHPELASVLSKNDIAALGELSDVSEVRDWTRRKVARYEKYIKALLAIHNSIAPIDELPTEILQQVFAHVPLEESEWCDASWMISLQSVCRRWRSVLLATPEYWLRGLHIILDPPLRMRVALTHEPVVDSDEEEEEEEEEEEDDISYSNSRDLFLARSAPCPLEVRELYTSGPNCVGWEAFEGHFDRVTTFSIEVQEEDELYDVLNVIRTSMKRLKKLELTIAYESEILHPENLTLAQWEAEDLPCLDQLLISNHLFSHTTTVPSLRSVTLYDVRDIVLLPDMLDALEGCPGLISLDRLYFDSQGPTRSRDFGDHTLNRIVNLPHLRSLEVCGETFDLSLFFSCVSFPSDVRIAAIVDDIDDQFSLPSILPRRLSRLHTSPTIDRLYIHSDLGPYSIDPPNRDISMIGSVQGAERLEVSSAFQLSEAHDFLRFLEAFATCTLTELALDLSLLPDDVDGAFWKQFFLALPDVRRLELISRTIESRETKRVIAEQFLASTRPLQRAGCGYETSLAWVLCGKAESMSHLEEELGDVEEVLRGHAHQGGHLSRLELYVRTSDPDNVYWSKVSGVAQVTTDEEASRFMAKNYVSRLRDVADTVIVGGGWKVAEDDGHTAEDRAGSDKEAEEETGSDNRVVV